MATGIQTNLQRGRRSGVVSPSKEPNYSQKALAFWLQLDKKIKVSVMGAIALVLIVGSWGSYSLQSNQFVDLYPLKLEQQDVRDVSVALSEFGIEHDITPARDGILLHPHVRRSAQARLASVSLPRYLPPKSDHSSPLPTNDERQQRMLRELESELVFTLRAVEQINDARVRIAIPKKTYFVDASREPKAAVFLKIANNGKLDRQTVEGIASLVAHSVPELTTKNVAILDHRGFAINFVDRKETFEFELQNQEEKRLEEKLQLALSRIYGDNVHAVVNLSLDFSSEEQRRYVPGSPADDGVVKDSFQLVEEMLEGASIKDGKTYDQRKESVNYKYMENYYARLRQHAKIERITASVMIDGASTDETTNIQGLVTGAIGLDESRGDYVYVSGIPWNHKVMSAWDEQPLPSALEDKPIDDTLWRAWAMTGFLCLVVFVGGGVLLTRRTRPLLTVETGGSGNTTVAGIVDQAHAKDGSASQVQVATGRQGTRMDALEQLVGDQPNTVAKMLRTTWLS